MIEDKSTEPKRKVGRPSQGKQGNITFRTRGDLRKNLVRAATATGRSLSEEVEHRLDQSFSSAGIIGELFGGRHTLDLVLAIAATLRGLEIELGRRWDSDLNDRLAARKAIEDATVLFTEVGPNKLRVVSPMYGEIGSRAGRDAKKIAKAVLNQVQQEKGRGSS